MSGFLAPPLAGYNQRLEDKNLKLIACDGSGGLGEAIEKIEKFIHRWQVVKNFIANIGDTLRSFESEKSHLWWDSKVH